MKKLFFITLAITTLGICIKTDSVEASWCNLNVDDALDYAICEQEYQKSGHSNYCNLNVDDALDYAICENHWQNR